MNKGQSIFEVILAMAIFAISVATVFHLISETQHSFVYNVEETRAIYLAREGIEAVRSIRDNDFASLSAGTHGLALSNNKWTLSGTEDITDKFTRQITISSEDEDTWQVKADISWQTLRGRAASVSYTDYLTNWRADIEADNWLVLHLDADSIEGLVDGDKISQWNDLSGKENHATQITEANQPTYKTNVLNGKPVVRLDGIDDYVATADVQIIPQSGDFSVIGVFKMPGEIIGNHTFIGTGTQNLNDFNFYGSSDSGSANNQVRVYTRSDGEIIVGSDIRGTGGRILNFIRNGTSATLYLDGVVDATGSSTGDVASKIRIGAATDDNDASRLFFNGDIAEILIYERALSDEQRQTIEQELTNKWLVE